MKGGSCLLERLYSAGLAVMKKGIASATAGTHTTGIHPLPGRDGGQIICSSHGMELFRGALKKRDMSSVLSFFFSFHFLPIAN